MKRNVDRYGATAWDRRVWRGLLPYLEHTGLSRERLVHVIDTLTGHRNARVAPAEKQALDHAMARYALDRPAFMRALIRRRGRTCQHCATPRRGATYGFPADFLGLPGRDRAELQPSSCFAPAFSPEDRSRP